MLLKLSYKLECPIVLPFFIVNIFIDEDLRELVDDVQFVDLSEDRTIWREV